MVKTAEKEEFKVIGLECHTNVQECASGNSPAPKLWEDFLKRSGEIKNRKGKEFYGVSCVTGECSFKYIVGVVVGDFKDVPINMVEAIVPKSKYVIFEHKGTLKSLPETYRKLYEKDMPATGLKQKDVWLEVYDERFKMDSEDSVMEILVAVE